MKTNGGKLAIMVGLLVIGLSPSFIDWQDSPDKRWQIVGYYGVAMALIGLGLWDGD